MSDHSIRSSRWIAASDATGLIKQSSRPQVASATPDSSPEAESPRSLDVKQRFNDYVEAAFEERNNPMEEE